MKTACSGTEESELIAGVHESNERLHISLGTRMLSTCWCAAVYRHFAAPGRRTGFYGYWGAAENWKNQNPGAPKLQAIYELTGSKPAEYAKWAADGDRPRATTAGTVA